MSGVTGNKGIHFINVCQCLGMMERKARENLTIVIYTDRLEEGIPKDLILLKFNYVF